ncbi:NAD(P)/FAD-dependent oxidoreductase [Actinokineospora iranica]|uniref:Nitrite reductase (NADH) large subunit n=1 Tax=Actinokineospora iranica TaxID=1271860 RepID=A0A1G6IN73_9PSEU|nr:FAD-dependent oxidoreductase [Actinokineospora iranica]SDC07880.1 nitrite reductase (NADH) large subunit [Actinokineospora iranica]
MTSTLVVVGHGMVGHRFVEQVRALDTDDTWRVVVLAEEHHPAYDRVSLSSYLAGKSKSDLALPGRDLRADPRVDLRLACPAVSVDRARRLVRTADGDEVRYDALVLATGSRPFVPPVPGHDLSGCFVYRTFDDLDALRAAARAGRPGVVVGGGLLGLEAANALRLLGMRAHVVETAPHLMPAQLDAGAARVLHRHLTGLGFDLRCATATTSVDADPDGAVRAVTLSDGTVLAADLVVFAAGVRPRDELAAVLGLARGERGGFAVDDHCRTADDRVWAIGECAAIRGRCHGLVAPGYRMADNVARQVLGQRTAPVDGSDASTTLKLLGVSVATFGAARSDDALEVVFAEGDARYAKVLLSRDTGDLMGGILAGDTGSWTTVGSFVGRPPPSDLERLLLP